MPPAPARRGGLPLTPAPHLGSRTPPSFPPTSTCSSRAFATSACSSGGTIGSATISTGPRSYAQKEQSRSRAAPSSLTASVKSAKVHLQATRGGGGAGSGGSAGNQGESGLRCTQQPGFNAPWPPHRALPGYSCPLTQSPLHHQLGASIREQRVSAALYGAVTHLQPARLEEEGHAMARSTAAPRPCVQ